MTTASRNRGLEIVVAMALLVFFHWLGAHRFYCGKPVSAFAMIALNIVGWATLGIGIGSFLLTAFWAWVVIDALLILVGILKPR